MNYYRSNIESDSSAFNANFLLDLAHFGTQSFALDETQDLLSQDDLTRLLGTTPMEYSNVDIIKEIPETADFADFLPSPTKSHQQIPNHVDAMGVAMNDFYAMGSLQQDQMYPPYYTILQSQQREKRSYEPVSRDNLLTIKKKIEKLNFKDVTVIELKYLLRECGASACGKKAELVERVKREYDVICKTLHNFGEIPWLLKSDKNRRYSPF